MEQIQIEDDSEKAESPLKAEDVAAIAVGEGVVLEEEVIHEQQPPPQYQNLIIQHMDIAEPLSTLKRLLEIRLQCSLAEHNFYLQDTILLDSSKGLVDQCVQGEGMVQINLEVKSQPGMKPKINILDILKPAEEVILPPNLPDAAVATTQTIQPQATKVVIPLPEESENVTRWIVDQNFRREQERLKIPHDPCQWSEVHVRHWIQWAVREFQLEAVDINQFRLNGKQLCDLQHDEFVKFIPFDRNDIFWTHLELLRKCKFVAVLQQPTPHAITTITVSTSDGHSSGKILSKTPRPRFPRITGDERITPGNRTAQTGMIQSTIYSSNNNKVQRGNNGQIQLWQFLLELLTDKEYRDIIQWVGDDGEFKLHNPEMVAGLWGQRKNKPTMNYEKLSRALRYYYDGDMIAKVHGKRFVYRFVCDLKMLLGYSSRELSKLIPASCDKKIQHIELIPQKLQHLSDEPLLTTITMKRVDQKTQTV